MPTSGTFLTSEDMEQLEQDLTVILNAIRIEGRVLTTRIIRQLADYQYFFGGAYDVFPGKAPWPVRLTNADIQESLGNTTLWIDRPQETPAPSP